MTKKRNKAAVAQKQKLRRQTIGILTIPIPMFPTSEASSTATHSVAGTVEREEELLHPQTTETTSSSFTKPLITASDPSSTATYFGPKVKTPTLDKSLLKLLDSVVVTDPSPPDPIITEHDLAKIPWAVAMCPELISDNKGRILSEIFDDLLKRNVARYPLPPDYDTDEELYGTECDGSHMAKEKLDMDWLHSLKG